MILSTALLCMALNVYWEARGESLVGQQAVAQVTMNRAGRDPKNVCGVVVERKQFSWTSGNVKDVNGRLYLSKRAMPRDQKAWEVAKSVAYMTLGNHVSDFTRGATYYHATYVNPYWNKTKGLMLVAVIGQHRFYKFA